MTAVPDTLPDTLPDTAPVTTAAPDGPTGVPAMSSGPGTGRPSPNLATLARLRGGGRNQLLSPTSRRARRSTACSGQRAR